MALYNKYRPQAFSEVISHEAVKRTLLKALEEGSLAQAIILMGPRGVGKTTIARLIAKSLNCQSPKAGEPCLNCYSCQAIAQGSHLDVVEIDAASNRGIDEIRELKEKIKNLPVLGKKKVYIIDEVHMLTKEAFNALLKTLEEPPSHIVFIMATTEAHKVPSTILSRAQRFQLKPARAADLKTAIYKIASLEKIAITDEALDYLADMAEGSFRDALSLLEQLQSYAQGREIDKELLLKALAIPDYAIIIQLFEDILQQERSRFIARLNQLFSGEYNFEVTAKLWLKIFKELLILSFLRSKEELSGLRFAEKLFPFVGKFPYSKLVSLAEELLNTIQIAKNQSEASLPFILFGLKVYQELTADFSSRSSQIENSLSKEELNSKNIVKNSGQKEANQGLLKQEQKKDLDPPASNDNLSWSDFLRSLAKTHTTLFTLLKDAEIEITSQKVRIFHQFSFHRKRLKDLKTRRLLEEILSSYYQKELIVEIIEESPTKLSHPSEEDREVVDDETFENTVIEVFELGV